MAKSDTTINTGGGTSVGKNVQTGGDFVGRDQINFIVPLGSWEEVRRLLFKDPARPVTKSIQEQFQNFDWAKAEQAYLDKVIKLYDRVRILGSSADVPLGNLFTQVYILDKPTARYRHDIEELRKRSAERNEFQRQPGKRIHGLDLVKTGQNLFILGKPGAGKTTFLKYITIQAARKLLQRIPIFVSLNQWADSRWGKGDKAALLPFLAEQFDICGFPDALLFIEHVLREGQGLVMFDGLDEVKQEKDQRRRLIHLLQDFAYKYDKSQHLITCRIAASDYAFTSFADVEVADFTVDQVLEYAHNWFGEQQKKLEAFTDELANPKNKGLTELCNTPLLLSLLCLTFDNAMRFPFNRAELYDDALETLLRKWDSSRQIQRDEVYRTLSHKRKLQLLMRIALPTFQKSEIFFRQHDLEKWIVDYLLTLPSTPPADVLDPTALLKAIEAQHSILVERAQGIYSFSHLTFQEYLTARTLVENYGSEAINKLVHMHLTDPRWREVFLLIANIQDDADSFIKTLWRARDSIITTEPTLIGLLLWTHTRFQQSKAPMKRQHLIHLAYIVLAFTRVSVREVALGFDFARDQNLERSLSSARLQELERVRSSLIGLAFASKFNLLFMLDSTRTFPLDFATSRSLASTTTPLVAFDYSLYYIWMFVTNFANGKLGYIESKVLATIETLPSLLKDVVALAIEGGEMVLAQQLLAKPIPFLNAPIEKWRQYADALFAVLRDQRNLGDSWNFTDEEVKKLSDYLYANELLIECLDVAAVSDRQAVLDGLLIPLKIRQSDKKAGQQSVIYIDQA